MPADFEPAVRLLRLKKKDNKTLYLVEFANKEIYWCDQISDELLRQYRLRQAARRRRHLFSCGR
jgi:hypothetical protein